jgi:hypothetical protein
MHSTANNVGGTNAHIDLLIRYSLFHIQGSQLSSSQKKIMNYIERYWTEDSCKRYKLKRKHFTIGMLLLYWNAHNS